MAKKAKKKEDTATSDEALLRRSQEHFNRSRNWVDEKIKPRWKADNDLYDSRFPEGKSKKSRVLAGQDKLFIPKTYTHTQRMLIDALDAYFFDKEEILNVTSWKSVPSETREITKALLNYRLNGHPISFYEEAYEACLDALKNKAGIFKVYPDFSKIRNIPEDEISFVAVDVDGEEMAYQPVIEAVPYEDIFFDPKATWKDYFKFPIVHRTESSLDYLKKRGYKNLKDLETEGDLTATDEIKQQRSLDQGSPFSSPARPGSLGMVYVYEVWDFIDINNDGYLESVSYLAGGDAAGPKTIIRKAEKNELPYRGLGNDIQANRSPFIMGNAFPEAHKLYGKSLPEIVEGLQRETNSIRNQDREAVALSLRKPLMVARHANVDLMSLVNRRVGGVVMGDDVSPSSVRELDVKGPTSSIQEQARTDQDFIEATSVSPQSLGITAPGEETATEVTARQTNANKRIAHAIRNLAQTLFQPAFKMLLRLEQQYASDEFVELVTARILGLEFSDDDVPARSVIQGDFELTVNASVSKQIQLNKWFLLIERAGLQNQSTAQMVQTGVMDASQAQFVDTNKLFNKVFPLLGEKDFEEYLVPAQAPPPSEGKVPGIASQPSVGLDVEAGVSNMSPEGTEGLLG